MVAPVPYVGLGEADSEIEAAVSSRLRLSLVDGIEDSSALAEALGM